MSGTTALCTTSACVQAANAIISYMAPNYTDIDPCTNWDAYMCDGFRATHTRRPDQNGISVGNGMSDLVTNTLRSILESPYPGESNHSSFSPRNLLEVALTTDEENFNLMETLYTSCLDEEAIKKEGAAPLVKLLEEIAQTFPINETSYGLDTVMGPEDVGNIRETLLYLHKIGFRSSLVSIGISPDLKNRDFQIVWVTPGSTTLPSPQRYKDTTILKNYKDAMSKVLAAVLPSKAAQQATPHLVDGIVELEIQLSALEPSPEDQGNVTKVFNPMSLSDTVALAPELGIDYIISALSPDNYTVNRTITPFPEYYKNMTDILAATPRDVVQTYFLWSVITIVESFARMDELKPLSQFWNVLAGKGPDDEPELWRSCVSTVSESLPWIMGRFFVESAFSEEAKQIGDQIVLELRQEFSARFKASDWMEDAVKQEAIAKVNNLVQKIGYPEVSPNLLDPESLKDWYAGLEFSHEWMGNNVAMARWAVGKQWANFPKPVDKDTWLMAPQVINAYYSGSQNEIVFPAGIMQFPLFGGELPPYVNYGAFGSIVGHEMTHAFDKSGREYDQHGVLRDWWTEATEAEFDKRSDCFVEQFENFTVTDTNGKVHHGNGKLALGENIADTVGMVVSYAVWKKRQAQTPDQGLPGLEKFTNDQLFFMFKTPFFCGKYLVEYEVSLMETNPHPPNSYRTVAPPLNSRAFREAFNCPVKEPTCELW